MGWLVGWLVGPLERKLHEDAIQLNSVELIELVQIWRLNPYSVLTNLLSEMSVQHHWETISTLDTYTHTHTHSHIVQGYVNQ